MSLIRALRSDAMAKTIAGFGDAVRALPSTYSGTGYARCRLAPPTTAFPRLLIVRHSRPRTRRKVVVVSRLLGRPLTTHSGPLKVWARFECTVADGWSGASMYWHLEPALALLNSR